MKRRFIAVVLALLFFISVVLMNFEEAKANAALALAFPASVTAAEAASFLALLGYAGIIVGGVAAAYHLYSLYKSYGGSLSIVDNKLRLGNSDIEALNKLVDNVAADTKISNVFFEQKYIFDSANYKYAVDFSSVPAGTYTLIISYVITGFLYDYAKIGLAQKTNIDWLVSKNFIARKYTLPYSDKMEEMITVTNDVITFVNRNITVKKGDLVIKSDALIGAATIKLVTEAGTLGNSIEWDWDRAKSKTKISSLPVGKDIVVTPPADIPRTDDDVRRLSRDIVATLPELATNTTTITLAPPANVATDRISPPSLSIPQVISQKFPFSLPWDYYRLIKLLDVQGETFKYDFTLFNVPMSVDFSRFENLISIFRKLLFLGFVFMLIPKTVTLLKGGDN